MLKEENLQVDYKDLSVSIKRCIQNKNFEKALELIGLSARIAYQYNFNTDFVDTNLEREIQRIAELNFKQVQVDGFENKVLFYLRK